MTHSPTSVAIKTTRRMTVPLLTASNNPLEGDKFFKKFPLQGDTFLKNFPLEGDKSTSSYIVPAFDEHNNYSCIMSLIKFLLIFVG